MLKCASTDLYRGCMKLGLGARGGSLGFLYFCLLLHLNLKHFCLGLRLRGITWKVREDGEEMRARARKIPLFSL